MGVLPLFASAESSLSANDKWAGNGVQYENGLSKVKSFSGGRTVFEKAVFRRAAVIFGLACCGNALKSVFFRCQFFSFLKN
ncbi:MAG: hypothetical protein OSJ58_03740 [Dysosmobacter sp.]|nr:hypothetical protein [Dysosmobacter sp.]